MTELSFAKAFLSSLDSRPSKFTADHIEDPKTYPARGAVILPKSTGPPLKKQSSSPTSSPTSSPSTFTVSLKSLRNPPLDVTIPSCDTDTSILNLKDKLSSESNIPVKALRILWNKKPVPDSKVLKDVLGSEQIGDKVEFGVMIIGGAAAIQKKEDVADAMDIDTGMGHGPEILKTEGFWTDLRGFLVQRLKDEGEGDRLVKVFRGAV
ncbi:cell-cycle control medial ring component-domain-containing protein [Amylocarpus encephaloides]|uniref:Cell-cycle control medial ring component-domain-containing protein n=1 Tax=Amylocarpus encephaloides TaxID=45428 RepID=A0A9P7YLU3_9HELO|nr:cell-cycle control medial ring component-domain-containing protein [Amylocarpus encephaloides]